MEKADRAKKTITFLLPKASEVDKKEGPDEQEVVEETEAGEVKVEEVEKRRRNKWRHDQKEIFSYPDLDPPASGYR